MYGFSSFHWDVAELAGPDRRAVEALDTASPPLPTAGYATHDPDGLLAAYRTLLRSDDVRPGASRSTSTPTRRRRAAGATRTRSPRTTPRCSRARAMLAVAPDPALPLTVQRRVTACWNSALGVMAFLTGDDGTADLPRIVEVLGAASAADLLDDPYPFWALEVRLVDAGAPVCERVARGSTPRPLDPRLSVGVRVAAIGACGGERYADRLAQGDAIAGLLDDPEIRVAVEAARVLAGLGGARDAEGAAGRRRVAAGRAVPGR